jgi:5-methylcytosine-specific restriction enzyme A
MKPQHQDKARRPWRHWYSTPEWRAIRAERLAIEPHCRMCVAEGRKTPAAIVDHVTPHRGRRELFFDLRNTQSLCKPHHDRDKQREELHGYSTKIGADGLPVDPRHPFNRQIQPRQLAFMPAFPTKGGRVKSRKRARLDTGPAVSA